MLQYDDSLWMNLREHVSLTEHRGVDGTLQIAAMTWSDHTNFRPSPVCCEPKMAPEKRQKALVSIGYELFYFCLNIDRDKMPSAKSRTKNCVKATDAKRKTRQLILFNISLIWNTIVILHQVDEHKIWLLICSLLIQWLEKWTMWRRQTVHEVTSLMVLYNELVWLHLHWNHVEK